MLRIWANFNRYVAGEKVTGRTTSGYVCKTTAQSDVSIIGYYNNLIANVTPNLTRSDYMKQYKITDYHAANNNCTTASLNALSVGLLPDIFASINNLDFEGSQKLGTLQQLAFNAVKNNASVLRLPFDLRTAIISASKHDEENTYKRNKNATPFP